MATATTQTVKDLLDLIVHNADNTSHTVVPTDFNGTQAAKYHSEAKASAEITSSGFKGKTAGTLDVDSHFGDMVKTKKDYEKSKKAANGASHFDDLIENQGEAIKTSTDKFFEDAASGIKSRREVKEALKEREAEVLEQITDKFTKASEKLTDKKPTTQAEGEQLAKDIKQLAANRDAALKTATTHFKEQNKVIDTEITDLEKLITKVSNKTGHSADQFLKDAGVGGRDGSVIAQGGNFVKEGYEAIKTGKTWQKGTAAVGVMALAHAGYQALGPAPVDGKGEEQSKNIPAIALEAAAGLGALVVAARGGIAR